MLERILSTNENWSPVIIRAMLALVLFPHGAQKVFGWFGGYGFSGTMDFFTGTAGLPWIIAFLVIVIEFLGPFFLAVGAFTRLTAIAIFGQFVGIILHSHIQYGFFMNWFGQMKAGQEGFEYHLLILAMSAALIISGAGKYSCDEYLNQDK